MQGPSWIATAPAARTAAARDDDRRHRRIRREGWIRRIRRQRWVGCRTLGLIAITAGATRFTVRVMGRIRIATVVALVAMTAIAVLFALEVLPMRAPLL